MARSRSADCAATQRREVKALPVLLGRAKVMHRYSDSASNKIGKPKQEELWQMQFIHVMRTASKATSSITAILLVPSPSPSPERIADITWRIAA